MKFDSDTLMEIEDALLRNKRRTLLTGFGVFWGIFMLLFLMGGGSGLKAKMSENFNGFATNSTFIASGTTSMPYKGMKEGRSWSFNYKDISRLKSMIPELDVVSPMISNWGQTAVHGNKSFSCNVKGLTADYTKVEQPKLKYGRFINEVDQASERKSCVIGKRVYTSLFPEGGDPCGQMIEVGSVWYNVVGVDFSTGNININGSADETVVIPLSVAQKVYHRGNKVDLIFMTVKNGLSASGLESRIRQVVAREHMFDASDRQAMMFMCMEQMFKMVDNLFLGLNFLILLIGLGTLLAGMIGVSNIMMVNVKSRTIEIGIRRAIGATPGDILQQVMLESVLLSTVAGSLGILFSVGILGILEKVAHSSAFQISFGLGVGTMALVVAMGVLASLVPATRAMKIRPVEAMRDE